MNIKLKLLYLEQKFPGKSQWRRKTLEKWSIDFETAEDKTWEI